MSRRRHFTHETLVAGALACALLCLLLGGGCRSVQLPRIDPTGERIFLAPPNYTTLETSAAPATAQSLTCLPQPAFQNPPTPPPCPAAGAPAVAGPVLGPPVGAVPVPVQPVVPQTHLTLTPARIVAPLKSQVVLIAGVCGPNGRYLAGETVEWFLAKESEGHFLELEGERISGIGSVLHPLPKKVSADYAVGKTSLRGGRIINCGKKNDEKAWLREGQTWISMTSATEGVSRVTAFSPDGDSSPARQETAEIYWVDAQWEFPAPVNVRAGNQATLSTRVTRGSNGLPLAGWIVRYEFSDGTPVAIGPQGAQAVDTVTDANGIATVNIAPQVAAAGSSEIRLTVLRPAAEANEPDRIPIGQGSTFITWSAPGLTVKTLGPNAAQVRTNATYQIQVSNPGDLTSSGVVASMVVPQGMMLVGANPQPRIVGDRLQWDVGELPPQTLQTLEVIFRCDQEGEFNVCSQAQSSTGELTAQDCISTSVNRPAIRLDMQGPPTAEVGEVIQFEITVTNEGQMPLRNVVLLDHFDPGLQSNVSASPLENLIGDLAPGQVFERGINFRVVAPGQHRNQAQVTSEGGYTASAQSVVNAVQPQVPAQPSQPTPATPPAIPSVPQQPEAGRFGLSVRGPQQRREREVAEYVVTATNQSNVTLQNVQVVVGHSASLVPSQASGGFQRDAQGNRIFWDVPQLAPGETLKYRLQFNCLRQDPQAGVGVIAVADNAPAERREVATQIFPAAAETRPAPAAPGEAAVDDRQGSLEVSIAERRNPIVKGGQNIYVVTIRNTRNVSDRNVALTIELGEGMVFKRLISGPPTGAPRIGNGVVEIPPIAEVRAGEQLKPFSVEVDMTKVGSSTITARVTSQRSPQGVTQSTTTDVFER